MSAFPNAGSSGGQSDDEPTREELYERAQELEIEGRSSMDKEELQAAVNEAESSSSPTVRDVTSGTPSASGTVPVEEGTAGELQTDGTPVGPGQARVVASAQPDHTPDEDGYVGVDPIYRNSSDNKRSPHPEGADDDSDE